MIPLPVADLHERISLGRVRGGALLTADEHDVLDRLLALPDAAGLLHARLHARRPVAFRVPDLDVAGVADLSAALAVLRDQGFVAEDVPWAVRAARATMPVLRAGCRRLGLPTTGRRVDLEVRLAPPDAAPHEGWDDAPWVRLPHAALVLRLERMGTLQRAPDPSLPVLERLGRLAWWPYATTPGGALVPDRQTWLAWEALVDALDAFDAGDAEAVDVDALLAALDRPHWPPGGLDLRREVVHRVRDLAHAAERAGDLQTAHAGWEGLVARGYGSGTVVQRLVHTRVAQGAAVDAYDALLAAHETASDADRVALSRTGRALARKVHRAWVPDVPRRQPRVCTLRLDRTGTQRGPRPRYASVRGEALVEEAAAQTLRDVGRTVLHAEGALWRTAVALLLADAMFVPVPGQLPVPRLAGPLDAFTPAFAARRPDAVQAVVDAVARGEGPARIEAAWDRYVGHVVVGVDWEAEPRAHVVSAARDVGAAALGALLRAVLIEGWRALRGLPDLVVLAGASVRVDGLHPTTVGPALQLIEVKGEHDTLRDAQLVWLDRFADLGVEASVWRVVARPG